MTFLLISFLAGLLTVLAPCILPLLPVVIGASATGRNRLTPYVVVGSLALSIIAFTFLLKVSTAFIAIPPEVWTYISGGILTLFGLTLVFPAFWERIPGIAKLSAQSNKAVGYGYQKKSLWGDVLIGAALGPVFSSCSPTYFVILASVLPASFLLGSVYLLAYVLGLSLVLMLLGLLGDRFAAKLSALSDSRSVLKRLIGILFILIGLLIITGIEKKIEAGLLSGGFFDVTRIEQTLLSANDAHGPVSQAASETGENTAENPGPLLTALQKAAKYSHAPELVSPDAYLNTGGEPISISEFIGKKVVLVDFWTYSCINCQRTIPYLTSWYDQYEDEGLVIIGVHTPEFAFEHVTKNVEEALQDFGIRYPVVLDNEYRTWNAFQNRFWPRKYLIDIDGYVVYDHAGEGEYEETETAIRAALMERAARLGEDAALPDTTDVDSGGPGIVGSPETYFGSARNEFLANGTPGTSGTTAFTLPDEHEMNRLYLGGTWTLSSEYATAKEDATLRFRYYAKAVYLVASAPKGGTVTVIQDGAAVTLQAGADVEEGVVQVNESRLYKIILNESMGDHELLLQVSPGVELYTFTFG